MVNVSELFKEIEFRVKSPLIGSFMIAWLIINWEVGFSILLYSNEALANNRELSKIDLVRAYSSWKNFFWLPLASALVYVFGFPFVRYGVQFFQAWVNKWGTKKTLSISEDGAITVKKYMQLRKEYQARTEALIDLFDKESSLGKLNAELDKKLIDLNIEKNGVISELRVLHKITCLSFFSGYWRLTITAYSDQAFFEAEERVLISGGAIYKAKPKDLEKKLYTILKYGYNHSSSEFIFWLRDENNENEFIQAFTPVVSGDFTRFKNATSDSIFQALEKE